MERALRSERQIVIICQRISSTGRQRRVSHTKLNKYALTLAGAIPLRQSIKYC